MLIASLAFLLGNLLVNNSANSLALWEVTVCWLLISGIWWMTRLNWLSWLWWLLLGLGYTTWFASQFLSWSVPNDLIAKKVLASGAIVNSVSHSKCLYKFNFRMEKFRM